MPNKLKRKRKPDIYAQEVARLSDEPYLILDAWLGEGPNGSVSPLFRFVQPGSTSRPTHIQCGCLTQIRRDRDTYKAIGEDGEIDEALTKQIANDRRIPEEGSLITVRHLTLFAWWQRKLDKQLKRKKLTHVDTD